jgi:hypothetical protein
MWSWLKSAGLALLAAGWLVAGAPAPANAFEAITGDGGETQSETSNSNHSESTAGPSNGASGDTDTRLAQAAARYEQAVGIAVATGPEGPQQIGTVWALRPTAFVTNAHVAEPLEKALASPHYDVFIAINKRPDVRLRVSSVKIHPKYGTVQRNFEGETSVPFGYDVAVLTTESPGPQIFTIASQATLEALRAGERVAYLGFPAEQLFNNNVNLRSPVATMKSGIVTAVTDYWQKGGNNAKKYLVKHDMGSAGGASGSPIFNANGEVIAVHNAGNYYFINELTENGVEKRRISHGAMINFAQRADLIHDLLR